MGLACTGGAGDAVVFVVEGVAVGEGEFLSCDDDVGGEVASGVIVFGEPFFGVEAEGLEFCLGGFVEPFAQCVGGGDVFWDGGLVVGCEGVFVVEFGAAEAVCAAFYFEEGFKGAAEGWGWVCYGAVDDASADEDVAGVLRGYAAVVAAAVMNDGEAVEGDGFKGADEAGGGVPLGGGIGVVAEGAGDGFEPIGGDDGGVAGEEAGGIDEFGGDEP